MTTQKPGEDVSPSKRREANWPYVLCIIHVHLLTIYGVWLMLTKAMFLTSAFCIVLSILGILGLTSGAHRLWTHRTYKANTFLRVLLMLFQTLTGIGPIYDWVVDHRLHHAHYGTDGDPYDHSKGFVFAHFISHTKCLSPYQEELRKKIDVSDLEADSIVMFQKQFYYWILYPVVFLLLPLNAPLEYWGESMQATIFIIMFVRYAIVMHASWLINSAALVWGLAMHDKYPADTNLVFIITKSYWPQYHYLTPFDYKCGEFGTYGQGCSTAFIRVCAALGWASDLRTVSCESTKNALIHAVNSGKPVNVCLAETEEGQKLPEDHFLQDISRHAS